MYTTRNPGLIELEVIDKLCDYFECNIEDLFEYIADLATDATNNENN